MQTAMASDTPIQTGIIETSEETWSTHRSKSMTDEKKLMAQHFASHDFLVRDGENPETSSRDSVATIIVNQGTSPNVVIEQCLEWIKENQKRGPFDITYYTSGHLIPTILRSFRQANRNLSKATQLFLLPGLIDLNLECVEGAEAEAFVVRLKRHFKYAFLSTYSFDLSNGALYFQFLKEIRLQRAIATRYARHKFLFLDSSKFTSKGEGEFGYGINDLLSQAEAVTIYTVSSSPQKDDWIKANFKALCDKIFDHKKGAGDTKKLGLQIVGRGSSPSEKIIQDGFLRDMTSHPYSKKAI